MLTAKIKDKTQLIDSNNDDFTFGLRVSGNIDDHIIKENDGITIDQYTYIIGPILNMNKVWELNFYFKVLNVASVEFNELIGFGSYAAIDLRTKSDNLYFTFGEDLQYTPEKIDQNIINSPTYRYALEDPTIKSSTLLNTDTKISLKNNKEYVIVYINDVPKIKFLSSILIRQNNVNPILGNSLQASYATGTKMKIYNYEIIYDR